MSDALNDGWIEWTGGENPVPGKTVNVRMRAGGRNENPVESDCFVWRWTKTNRASDIIAYRVVPAPTEKGDGVVVTTEMRLAANRVFSGGKGGWYSVSVDIAARAFPAMYAAMRAAPDPLPVALRLYESFWTRNGGDVEAFDTQAPAIRTMWLNIAADAILALTGETSRE